MAFTNWIASIFGKKKKIEDIQKLKNEITKISKEYQEVLKEYEEFTKKLKLEIDGLNNKYQELKNNFENEQRINNELRKELETKGDVAIKRYEESIQKLKKESEEINNRYQDAIEKLHTEREHAATLEILILELDKELGLMDLVKKTDTEILKKNEMSSLIKRKK